MHTLTLALTGLAALHWACTALRSFYSTREEDELRRQAAQLSAQLRRLRRSRVAQEQRAEQLAAHLRSKVRGNQILWEAVESLTCALFEARAHTGALGQRCDWERSAGFHQYHRSVALAQDLSAAELKLAEARGERLALAGDHCGLRAALERLTSTHGRLEQNHAQLQLRIKAREESEREIRRRILEGADVGDSRAASFQQSLFVPPRSF